MDKFYHSVRLDPALCKGCINCIKRCPTQAIRVRNGKAQINGKFCIDCGECIRVCPHHAKHATYDKLDVMKQYEYTVALPAPSLYGQFNNLDDVNIVLNGLLLMGFDDVFEVGAAAEIVSEATRSYLTEHEDQLPVISTACPSVVRLIRVRFPNLIPHLLPLNPPVEVAACMAVERAMKKTGLAREKIGIIFISPCPSKVTYVKSPLGTEKSEVDHVLAIKEVYPQLLSYMKVVGEDGPEIGTSGKIGVSWGRSGGEASGLFTENYLAADGIENVIRVLEDLEDQKLPSLKFVELNACSGGCVGGVLTVENPYVAGVK
ncbi:MAG: [Fe-Fe] hydrogenase large subunit C-terminal domain-containing protein, partial [Hungatella hathewayi]